MGVNCKSLFVDGTLHVIGGSKNRRHLYRHIYDRNDVVHRQSQKVMKPPSLSTASSQPQSPPSLSVMHSASASTDSIDSYASGDEDDFKNGFHSMFKFKNWSKGIQNCGLVHVRSKGQFILFGGYDQYSDHKYQDMVYVLDRDGKRPRWIKKCKMPERACYFGALSLSQSLTL